MEEPLDDGQTPRYSTEQSTNAHARKRRDYFYCTLTMTMPRSVYLSRLRRAFLLRVHPDRFRNQSADIRSDQASVVKALADRLVEPDFLAWQQNASSRGNGRNRMQYPRKSSTRGSTQKSYAYVLERKDGSFFKTSLPLGGSVRDVLNNMTESLRHIGAYSLPALSTLDDEQAAAAANDESNHRQQHHGRPHDSTGPASSSSSMFASGVNHQYDIRSRQGRDLQHFLSTLSQDEITERRLDRTDAQAAAMQVRKLYQFQSVDATSLGWSSASVAVLLNQLLVLHEEFCSKLLVESFYPMQLLFTSDDFQQALDVHGGVLRLNPASTKLQSLEKLQLVTPATLEAVRFFRSETLDLAKRAQSIYNLHFKKGFTCSNKEYYDFLCRICSADEAPHGDSVASERSGKFLTMTPLTATIESEYGCRRPTLNKDGSIRLGANMDHDIVRSAVAKLSVLARDLETEYQMERERCMEAIHLIEWDLGVERVYKNRTVQASDFLDCLSRIISTQEEGQKSQLKTGLTGNALGVASSGAFCHLADDGAIVIPVDWS